MGLPAAATITSPTRRSASAAGRPGSTRAPRFGRTPGAENSDGRDHHPYGFTIWLAGGGVKRGLTYGATDEFGYNVVKDPVHVHDFQATLLHLLGIDHEKLTFKFQGRRFRLTDVHGRVVEDLLA